MPENTGDTNETIVIRWLVDNKEAIQRHKELRQVVDTIREQLRALSKESNATYKEMAESMVKTFSKGKVKELRDANPMLSMKDAMKQAKPEIELYKQAMSTALSEVQLGVKNTGTVWSTVSKDIVLKQRAEAQAVKEAQRQEREASRQATQGKLADVKQQSAAMKQLEQDAKKTANAMKVAGGGGGGLGGALGGGLRGILGGIGSLVGITSAVMLFRQLINFIQQATDSAYDFQKSLFGMVVGVRALQRAGVDITISEMVTQLKSLKDEFGVFSMKDLVEGSSAFLNLNRDMGFTKEQLFELQRAIATLAVVNGRSMDEVQRTVALALSSGYTEGLQRLGVSINRVTIAAEAANMGWKGGYTSLTEVQRAAATYNLVIRKTAIYQEDLLKYQETLPGQIDTTTKAIEDQTVAWGNNTMALKLWLLQAKESLLEAANDVAGFLRYINEKGVGKAEQQYAEQYVKLYEEQIGRALERRGSEATLRVSEYEKKFLEGEAEFRRRFIQEGMRIDDLLAEMGLGDTAIGQKADTKTAAAEAAVEDQLDAILEAQEQFQEDSTDLWDEYQKDLLELSEDHWAKERELFDEWAKDYLEAQHEHEENVVQLIDENEANLAAIEEDWKKKREEANTQYLNDVADTWRDYYRSIEDAQRDYANNMEEAEIAFQERMRKLREGFLFDLEDALRARDARQVLQLIRRYNLSTTQAEREYQQQKEKMARDFQRQMEDLARQRDERLAMLYEELQQRLLAIDAEREEEKKREAERYAKEQEEEKRRWIEKQTELAARYKEASDKEDADYQERVDKRNQRYGEDLQSLKDHLADRYKEIAKALADEVGVTQESMNAVLTALANALGPGSTAELIYGYYVGYVNRAAQQAATAMGYIAGLQQMIATMFPTMYPTLPGPNLPGQAEGGAYIADRPTRTTFGEAGPELAAFIPLRSGARPTMSVGGGEGGGRVQVEISLDEYLEGRIIDTTLDNVADVIIRRLR